MGGGGGIPTGDGDGSDMIIHVGNSRKNTLLLFSLPPLLPTHVHIGIGTHTHTHTHTHTRIDTVLKTAMAVTERGKVSESSVRAKESGQPCSVLVR